jgi:1-phosphofructokinase family hexose kinase
MILVAGLTPAWQQIAVLKQLRPGEVNRAREVHWCASGKVLNVGLALTRLQVPVRTLSLLGSGPAGNAVRQDVERHNLDVRWIPTESPMRVCTTLLERDSLVTTEIVENSGATSDRVLTAFHAAFVEEIASRRIELVILTGSLPQHAPNDFFARLLSRTKADAILDARGPELLAALPQRPLVVKPNRDELARTLNRPLVADDNAWQGMHALHALGAQWVVVTNGDQDVLASHGSERLRFTPPSVRLLNPIGCGDCFTAGLAWGLLQNQSMPDAIRAGLAAAAQNAEELLPARLDLQTLISSLGHSVTASTA